MASFFYFLEPGDLTMLTIVPTLSVTASNKKRSKGHSHPGELATVPLASGQFATSSTQHLRPALFKQAPRTVRTGMALTRAR